MNDIYMVVLELKCDLLQVKVTLINDEWATASVPSGLPFGMLRFSFFVSFPFRKCMFG